MIGVAVLVGWWWVLTFTSPFFQGLFSDYFSTRRFHRHDQDRTATVESDTLRVFGPARRITMNNGSDPPPDHQNSSDFPLVTYTFYTPEEQLQYVLSHASECFIQENVSSFSLLRHRQALTEIWKYCMFQTNQGDAYYDPENIGLFVSWKDLVQQALLNRSNLIVVTSANPDDNKYNTQWQLQSSFMYMDPTQDNQLLYQASIQTLIHSQDYIDYASFQASLIENIIGQSRSSSWNVLYADCMTTPSPASLSQCSLSTGAFCCQARMVPDPNQFVLSSRHHNEDDVLRTVPVLGIRRFYLSDRSQILNQKEENENPYQRTIATVQSVSLINHTVPQNMLSLSATPNFYDILLENDCLPTTHECFHCMKDIQAGSSCEKCGLVCGCFCRILCQIRPPPKPVTQRWLVSPPLSQYSPGRLIPRMVHQTWYEPIIGHSDKYPYMSRFVESFRTSGWEHHFYTDESAADFLSQHFPPAVREAYDALLPGAFKADLFRYCVLLIHGGLYADTDILLESHLDALIPADASFVTALDAPGEELGHRSCLWNGFLAAAPGHPFLARTIELVVNNIRNRFTSIDYDDMLCPNPVLSISHKVDVLFTSGPCVLGAAINDVLQRHRQTGFEAGDWKDLHRSYRSDRMNVGRVIVLNQEKEDMGAHRFTKVDTNQIAAGTDFPEVSDRDIPVKQQQRPAVDDRHSHYSSTHQADAIYGLEGVYVNQVRANEEISLTVVVI